MNETDENRIDLDAARRLQDRASVYREMGPAIRLPVLRQRFTAIGWIGVAFWIIGPLWGGYLLAAASSSRCFDPAVSGIGGSLTALMMVLVPVLILIGREYYGP
ncbi:MAG: hypothetical protein Q4G26_09525 [Paracoccus sp. (in: a-proteobacteria)]|nr:hypothetical protein [Paracoccus sp. (in: a-proteobacteria)]